MNKLAAAVAILGAIGGLIGAGSFITYTNVETNIDSHDQTINEGDTIFDLGIDEIKEDLIRTGIEIVCKEDPTLAICDD